MIMRFNMTPFRRALAWRDEIDSLSGLVEGDCHVMPSVVVRRSTVVEVVVGFLARNLDH